MAFYYYQKNVRKIIKNIPVNFLFVSTSKLFSGYLAYRISKSRKILYYLDLRDLFAENIREYIKWPFINALISLGIKTLFERSTLLHACHININSEGFRENIPVNYKGSISFYPNGIDDEFIGWKQESQLLNDKKIICYAGNIGEGQGLEKIIPHLAKRLQSTHQFIIIGEGASKNKLIQHIKLFKLTNVRLIPAVPRKDLLRYYKTVDYLFLHLNDYKSFEKVLPSKIFEYACGDIPILAGVKGYARSFIQKELGQSAFIFNPCEIEELADFLINHTYQKYDRSGFVEKYNRSTIVSEMSDSIIDKMIKVYEKS